MTKTKIDSYHLHEALHVAALFVDWIDGALVQHPAIAANPEWKALAEEAAGKLADLYQAIGADTRWLGEEG